MIATMIATLVTFPPSLDSELSRFLLAHYELQYEERPHALIFCPFVTLWRGRTVLFPLLYGKSYRLTTARKIVDHFDPLCAADRRLLPSGADRRVVEADWPLFNDTLAFASATFAYYHLLKHREIMIRPLSDGAPAFEVGVVGAAYPLFAGLLRLMLRLTAARAEAALAKIRTVIEAVDERLADGRPYLIGDRFSLSDMAFAVAAAPLVLPEPYAGRLPAFSRMPPEVRSAIDELRPRPAAQFALRIYRDHRGHVPAS